MRSIRITASLCLLLFAASVAFAQNASVTGTVTDPSGATIAGATVTALNNGTGVASPTKTNQAGVFAFPSLPVGTYSFSSQQTGFSKETINNVILETGSQLTVNLGLQLGQATQTIEVEATAATVNASSATVGDVVTGKQLQDLPLVGRSAYNLISTQPGVIGSQGTNFYINGNQGNAVNYTMDGINAMNNLLTGTFYLYSNVVSQDRTEEAKIVTSPADAEYGRGAALVQMTTRGGTNRFVGSAWEEFRNTDLNANTFFNNANGNDPVTHNPLSPRQILIQNNFGVRFGGPVILPHYNGRNKTFFNGIYDPYKQRQSATFTADVYTAQAKAGIFRYYQGALNGNANAAIPTVDLSGNPVSPNGTALQSVSVLGVDPNRLVADTSGLVAHNLAFMPLPNNFRVGDGLNIAGYTWNRPIPVNFQLYEGRVDHIINDQERISITMNQQSYHSINVATPPTYPSIPWQADPTETTQYSFALTSVLRPTLINEIRIGVFRPRTTVETPASQSPSIGPVNNKGLLPVANGVAFNLCYSGSLAAATSTSCTSPAATAGVTNATGGNASDYIAPVYQYGDALTWIRGKHSFKGGVEVRLISDAGYDANGVVPNVVLGANGAVPIQGISTFPGIGSNITVANNLLTDLTGSVLSENGTNFSAGGANPVFTPGLTRFREWHQNEASFYFKDDFKLKPYITLNLGVRYELYKPPYEGQGKGAAPVGGAGAFFGISGTTFANGEFQPGALNGAPTVIQSVGYGSTHPNQGFFNTDYNNFAPAVGFAWSLQGDKWKWLTGGRDQTTIRSGYGWSYQRLEIYLTHQNGGFIPGLAEGDTVTSATKLTNLILPIPPVAVPLTPNPLVGPGSHNSTPLLGYDPNIRTPYIQNYNFSIQRAINQSTSITLAYVGTKGTKLVRAMDTNEVNIYNNGFLSAFQTVQAGGDSPLMDQIFANLPVASAASAVAAAGGGSGYVRSNSSFFTFLANNNPGGLANALNTTTFGTNLVGGLVPNAKLPANFFVANPQFLDTYLTGNFGNSTYNSLQLSATKRFGRGFSLQGSYVWSKALGEDDGQSSTQQAQYRTFRNASLDKQLLSFDHRGVFKLNGIYELP
ncbi:MAG TPA: carboxypeptidase regulatory-like domain-containing protein, partial [Bryobacteraceae bacterium]|nr:carboxypeptidase regulatory-like domain-containing protein [Bryobacteraceae bacterium]